MRDRNTPPAWLRAMRTDADATSEGQKKVVPLTRPQAGAGIAPHQWTTARRRRTLAQVEAYWTALCKQGLPPARAQIDPRGMETALEHAFVAERITQGEARVRVGGVHLSDLMGMEVRGMPLSAIIAPDARHAMSNTLRAVFDTPAICRMTLDAPGGIGRPGVTAQMLMLPLRGDADQVNRVLGCIVCDGPVGRTPRRFQIAESEITALTAAKQDDSPPSIAKSPVAGFAEPGATYTTPGPLPLHLRLIKNE